MLATMAFENGWLARVVFRASTGAQEMVNVFHYNTEIEWPDLPLGLQALADRLRDDALPDFKALFSAGWTCDPVVVVQERDPLNPNEPRTAVQSGASGPGTRPAPGGDAIPEALCRVYKLNTALIGRSFRGRK